MCAESFSEQIYKFKSLDYNDFKSHDLLEIYLFRITSKKYV